MKETIGATSSSIKTNCITAKAQVRSRLYSTICRFLRRSSLKKLLVILLLLVITLLCSLALFFWEQRSVSFSTVAVKGLRQTGPSCKPDRSSIWGLCKEIFAEKLLDKNATEKIIAWKPEQILTDSEVLEIVEKCPKFQSHFCFPTLPLTKGEADFPLAFVVIIHSNLDQIFRLLQSIYWPQNLYCVTYDEKSSEIIKNFLKKLLRCFSNIITPESHETIYWGQFGVLKAAVECLKLLHARSHQWRYVQILSGNDFPLRTNREMVEIFKVMNGTSDSELAMGQEFRYTWPIEFIPEGHPTPASWKLRDTFSDFAGTVFINKSKPKSPIPHGLTVYKGSFAATLSRQLVNYAIRNPVAIDFYEWLRDTYIPDEQFWATLIHNTQYKPPGGFPGSCLDYFGNGLKPFISRFHIWSDTVNMKCHGKYIRGSCLFGVGDLRNFMAAKSLVAHRMYMDFQPATFYCLKDWLNEKTYEEKHLKSLDMEYYRNLPAVKYRDKIEKEKNCSFIKQAT